MEGWNREYRGGIRWLLTSHNKKINNRLCLKLTNQEMLQKQAYYLRIEGNYAQELLRVAAVAGIGSQGLR